MTDKTDYIIHDYTTHLPYPPHEAWDSDKVAAMLDLLRQGRDLPPVVVWDNDAGGGINKGGEPALCGSHRIEAYRLAEELINKLAEGWEDVEWEGIPVVYVDDELMQRVAEELGCDLSDVFEQTDFNTLCGVVYRLTDDPAVKAALEDQRD